MAPKRLVKWLHDGAGPDRIRCEVIGAISAEPQARKPQPSATMDGLIKNTCDGRYPCKPACGAFVSVCRYVHLECVVTLYTIVPSRMTASVRERWHQSLYYRGREVKRGVEQTAPATWIVLRCVPVVTVRMW